MCHEMAPGVEAILAPLFFSVQGVIMHCRKEYPKGGHYLAIILPIPFDFNRLYVEQYRLIRRYADLRELWMLPTLQTLHSQKKQLTPLYINI